MKKHLKKLSLISIITLAICIFSAESVLAKSITTSYGNNNYNSKILSNNTKIALSSLTVKSNVNIGYVYTNGATLNVRKTPSTSGIILGKLSNGTKVEIVDKSISGWYKIKYSSGYGYISRDYVSFTEPSIASKWVYPMNKYTVTQKFNNKYSNGKYHLGIDIKSSDKSILAVADGIVTSAKNTGNNANGNCIVIEHTLNNGSKIYSAYAHLASMSVKSGIKVKAGQKIGVMGNTGNSTGPHLHFTIFNVKSESPYGYGTSSAVNGIMTYGNRKFYDPIKFVESNGTMITGNTSNPSVSKIEVGYVATNGLNLNVRKTASASGSILGKLSNGTKVEIVDKSISGWYKIKYGSGYGYVSKDYISFTANKPSTSTIKVTGVKLDKTSTSIIAGNTTTLIVTVAPSNAINKQVTWKSSNTSVATVDANGKVKGIKAGSVTITVTTQDGSKIATCKVTVENTKQSVTIGYVSTTGSNLNVRKTASASGTILGKLSNRTKVEIVDKSISGWYKIKYGSGYGYVSKDYISLNSISTTSAMKVSNNLIEFIKGYEGFRSKPYKDLAGNLTIGYGHLIKSGEKFTSITKEEATALLKKDIALFEASVNSLCKGIKLKQNEFDSLVSFSFNLGSGKLQKSDLLAYIKNGGRDSTRIKNEYMKYVMANGSVARGLKNRRYSEWKMFSYGEYKRYSVF